VLQDGWEQTYPVAGGDSSGLAPDQGTGGPDVNGDGYVSAQDVLLIVNGVNAATIASGGVMEASAAGDPLDVNGDGVISAMDALLVINWINRPTRGLAEAASGEGGTGLSDTPVAHVVQLAPGEHRDDVDFGTRPLEVDDSPPRSGIEQLASPATNKTIELNVWAQDEGVAASGVAWIDVYVSVDQSAFTLWKSFEADPPTANFTTKATFEAESNRMYGFRTLARDAAGNVETKPLASDAWTIIPDLDAPVTQVDSYLVDASAAVIQLDFSGIDPGGSGLASFQLWVQVDNEGPTLFATYAAGALVDSVYSGSATYAALRDDTQHAYRFYTVGIDGHGNVETPPEAPADVVVMETFAAPTVLTVTGFDVQRGALQRSYIQYVDVTFNVPDGVSEIDSSRLRLQRYSLNGENPVDVPLDDVNLQAVDEVLTLDFGEQGIGGDRNGLAGNGYYGLLIDTDDDLENGYEVERFFYRLAGDTNRDRRNDSLDLLAVNALLASGGYDENADVNGDGVINASDRLLVMRGRNQVLASHLRLDD
jgi:hypothetical protein